MEILEHGEGMAVVLFRKILLVLTLLAIFTVMMGWVPKWRINRLMWFTGAVLVVGFAWRVGSWYLSF